MCLIIDKAAERPIIPVFRWKIYEKECGMYFSWYQEEQVELKRGMVIESNRDSVELTTRELSCGVNYGIHVFDDKASAERVVKDGARFRTRGSAAIVKVKCKPEDFVASGTTDFGNFSSVWMKVTVEEIEEVA